MYVYGRLEISIELINNTTEKHNTYTTIKPVPPSSSRAKQAQQKPPTHTVRSKNTRRSLQ
jgi:hypothetical protein